MAEPADRVQIRDILRGAPYGGEEDSEQNFQQTCYLTLGLRNLINIPKNGLYHLKSLQGLQYLKIVKIEDFLMGTNPIGKKS